MALSTSHTAITDFFLHVLKVLQFLWINARMRKGSRVLLAVVYFLQDYQEWRYSGVT